jgi:nitroimidazol reductase NimA-like FMN-containing flavoprotein (pyridoxamine 5'-phosphate oxidase superfamily)
VPGPMTEGERQEFLAGRHVGVVSVTRGDGRPPHSTPVWYAYEPGGNISFFTGTQGRRSRKAELVREAGALSFLVQREEVPYGYVTVEGTVVGEDRPPSAEQVLVIVRRYIPEQQAQWFVDSELRRPSPEFVLFTVRPDRWLSFDFSDDQGGHNER